VSSVAVAGPGGPIEAEKPSAASLAETVRGAIGAAPVVAPSRAELRAIWRLLRRVGIGASDLDDAVQQVFLVAAERAGSFDPAKRSAFLYGVALRVALNLFQRGRRDVLGLEEARVVDLETPSVEELVDRQKARALLDQVLLQMPLELRIVFVLSELEDVGEAEIAQALELPRGTVASRLRRARRFFSERVARLRRRNRFRGAVP